MAIFTIDKFGGGDIAARADYFEKGEGRELAHTSGGEDYYHMPGNDTLLSEFVGQGAEAMGLGITPRDGDYAALMSGKNPRTDESYVSDRRQGELERGTGTAGFSTSFNVDKTLSLVYAALDRDQQIIFEKAMMEASRSAFEHAEKQGYFAYRLGAQGVDRHAGKAMAASYLHFTSRNQEPHLHVHVEIPNACLGEDGQWRPLEGGELYRRQAEFAALFDAYLAHALGRDIPELAKHLEVDLERNGLRIAGISRETVLEFSTRRIEVLKRLEEMGASGAEAARGAAKRTREAKKEKNSDVLRSEWREQLSNLQNELTRGDLSPETKLFAEQLVFRNASVFGEHALDRAAAQLCILHGGVGAIPAIKSGLIRQLGVIELPQEGRNREFTTEAYRQLEAELLSYTHAAQRPEARFALSAARVNSAIEVFEREKGFSMREEQRAAVRHCAEGARFQVLQGAAGTGKSASLAALRMAYEGAGSRVMGLAPSGAAAAELENSAGIRSSTIHALLMRLENDNPRYREKLLSTDVIVCDEAGLADLRTLHKLAGYCDAAGAKLILVGDGRQLEAVGSASSLDMLTEEVGCAEIVEIARQRDPADRAISQAWFEGPAEQGGSDALDMMKARGLLKMPAQDIKEKPIDLLMRDALEARAGGTSWKEILLLADRNQSVRSLNGKVREHRFEIGELDKAQQVRIPVETGRGDYADLDLAPGDRIMLRKNQKLGDEQVYNGDRATLKSIDRVEVDTDDNGEPIYDTVLTAYLDRTKSEVSWKLSDYASIDHAYAMTVHKSQGLTVNRAFYLTSESTDRRLAYVAFTRSREAAGFYLNTEDLDTLARNTEGFKSKRCALDADKEYRELIRANARAGMYDEQPIKPQIHTTKDLLEKAGERFEYPAEPKAEPKLAPEIEVLPASQDEHDLALARGYAVAAVIDKPDDTPLKPGKPYDIPAGANRVALLAEPLPLPPVPKIEREHVVSETQSEGASMTKQRRVWTKAEQQKETQAIRERVDLRAHAEHLGYAQVSGSDARIRMENRNLDKADPLREITLKPNAQGDSTWMATKGGKGSGLGGDVFHLHQKVTGKSFLESRDDLRKIAFNAEFEGGQKYEGMSTPEREAKIEQRRQDEALKTEARRAKVYGEYKKTSAEPNAFLLQRGVSDQTIAETKSRTDRHGNAVFPHVREDGKFAGFERKNEGKFLYSKSERGIYVANPGCENPDRIKSAESGLDALSLYQMDTPEQRARTLYVSTGGNPAADSAAALQGLAQRTGAKQVDMVYDRDKAGDGHTESLKKLLAEKNPELKVEDRRADYAMKEGEDPNDLLQRQQRESLDREKAQQLAAQATPEQPQKGKEQQPTEGREGQKIDNAPTQKSEPARKAEPEPEAQEQEQEQEHTQSRGRSM